MRTRIQFTGVEDVLAAMDRYAEKVIRVAELVAQYMAPIIEAYAKQEAEWKDRTGNARQTLFTDVELANDIVTLYLSHGMDYGKWLELAHQGKYAIILPALEAHYEQVMKLLREALG